MTLDVMAHSLVYWTQDLFFAGLLAPGARIFAMTSAGDHIVWPAYGAVSAAKAALESHVRQLAVELAPHRVAVNALRAGVTDTPALRKIPGQRGDDRAGREDAPGRPADAPRGRRGRARRALLGRRRLGERQRDRRRRRRRRRGRTVKPVGSPFERPVHVRPSLIRAPPRFEFVTRKGGNPRVPACARTGCGCS